MRVVVGARVLVTRGVVARVAATRVVVASAVVARVAAARAAAMVAVMGGARVVKEMATGVTGMAAVEEETVTMAGGREVVTRVTVPRVTVRVVAGARALVVVAAMCTGWGQPVRRGFH